MQREAVPAASLFSGMEDNMFTDKMERIDLCGQSYPYRCDMVVLEQIQKEFGDVLEYENAIRGIIPYYDEETGLRDKKKDRSTVPDIHKVCLSLAWMIEEGIAVSGEALEPLGELDIKRQDEYSITNLALKCFEEYAKCFLSKKGRSKAPRKGSKKNNTNPTV